MPSPSRIVAGLFAALLCVAACGTSKSSSSSAREWTCGLSVDGNSCSCEAYGPDTVVSVTSEVPHCVSNSCCLLTDGGSGGLLATCECFDPSGTCAAEAASRTGAMVVSQCPPASEDTSKYAAPGENCTGDYLSQMGLVGCASGTVCQVDAQGVRTCQAASAQEQAWAATCDAEASRAKLGQETLTFVSGSVVTNFGTLPFDTVMFPMETTGPNGCLNSLTLQLQTGTNADCNLSLGVGLVGGKLAVTSVAGVFNGCSGFPALAIDTTDPTQIPFGFSFQGVSCDAQLVFEAYCVSGTYDFHLTGTFNNNGLPSVTFTDGDLVLQGALCGLQPQGVCPTP